MSVYIEPDRAQLAVLQRTLRGLAHALGAQRKFLRERVLPYLRERTDQQFYAEQNPEGVEWTPLSEAYARRKARRFPGLPILQRTRNLWLSLMRPSSPGAINETASTGDGAMARYGTAATTRSGANRGWIHQGERRARGVPKREILGITEGRAYDILGLEVNFIDRAMRGM